MSGRRPISRVEATHCRKPLLAYDGSPAADRALDASIELTSASHGRLTILSAAVQVPYLAYTGAAPEAVAELRKSCLTDAERVLCRGGRAGPSRNSRDQDRQFPADRAGAPARGAGGDHDLGHPWLLRGRGPIRSVFFGNVGRTMLRHGPLPVLIVARRPDEAAVADERRDPDRADDARASLMEPERQQTGITLGVLSIGGPLLRAAAVDGRPGTAGHPADPAHHREHRRLDPHRLPAQRLGRDADHRPPRRHVRQGAALLVVARRALPSARCLAALATSIGVLIAGRVDPGRRRRHLPARLRDHPRRVPARAGRRRHRADLGDPRHRRRPRHRPRRADRRHLSLPLALLDPARSRS